MKPLAPHYRKVLGRKVASAASDVRWAGSWCMVGALQRTPWQEMCKKAYGPQARK